MEATLPQQFLLQFGNRRPATKDRQRGPDGSEEEPGRSEAPAQGTLDGTEPLEVRIRMATSDTRLEGFVSRLFEACRGAEEPSERYLFEGWRFESSSQHGEGRVDVVCEFDVARFVQGGGVQFLRAMGFEVQMEPTCLKIAACPSKGCWFNPEGKIFGGTYTYPLNFVPAPVG